MKLDDHMPSEATRRRAEAAGIDLTALKREDPTAYAALNAARLLRTEPELMTAVGEAVFAAFPEHQVFNLPAGARGGVELLIFPPLEQDQLKRLDEVLGRFVDRPEGRSEHRFYRIVNDVSGEHRELARPRLPQRWSGEEGLVGPFADRRTADTWGRANVSPREGAVYDAVPYGGAWFCDVFSGELG